MEGQMALLHSKYTQGALRVPAPDEGGEVYAVRFEYAVPTDVADGDIIEVAVLPAYCRVVDAILDADALDEGSVPAILLDVGLMSGEVGEELDADGNARTCGAELFNDMTTAQAGGVARVTLATALRIAPVAYDRSIGVKVVANAATAAASDIGLTLLFGT